MEIYRTILLQTEFNYTENFIIFLNNLLCLDYTMKQLVISLLTLTESVELSTVMSIKMNVPCGTVTVYLPSAVFSIFSAPATLPPVRTNVTVGSTQLIFVVSISIVRVPSDSNTSFLISVALKPLIGVA